MREVATPLRAAYGLALEGNIIVNAAIVPVYYGKVVSTISSNFFILIPEISVKQRPVMRIFIADARVYIDIIQRMPADISADQVESAANQIMQIVKPTPETKGISVANPFKLIQVTLEDNDGNRPAQIDAAKFIVQKSLVFNNIIQN